MRQPTLEPDETRLPLLDVDALEQKVVIEIAQKLIYLLVRLGLHHIVDVRHGVFILTERNSGSLLTARSRILSHSKRRSVNTTPPSRYPPEEKPKKPSWGP